MAIDKSIQDCIVEGHNEGGIVGRGLLGLLGCAFSLGDFDFVRHDVAGMKYES